MRRSQPAARTVSRRLSASPHRPPLSPPEPPPAALPPSVIKTRMSSRPSIGRAAGGGTKFAAPSNHGRPAPTAQAKKATSKTARGQAKKATSKSARGQAKKATSKTARGQAKKATSKTARGQAKKAMPKTRATTAARTSAGQGASRKSPPRLSPPAEAAPTEWSSAGVGEEAVLAAVDDLAPCRMVDHGCGRFSLCLDDFRMPRLPQFLRLGLAGNGYTWEALAGALVRLRHPEVQDRIAFASERSMFVAVGARTDLVVVALLLRAALADPALLQTAIDAAASDRLE